MFLRRTGENYTRIIRKYCSLTSSLILERLFYFQKIGVYYRGYVDTEVDLDLLLTYHKQQTQSFWGTRQSPSPAKPSTRLMWKSQYVPFDGVPFINSGKINFCQKINIDVHVCFLFFASYKRDVRNELLISIWRLQISS